MRVICQSLADTLQLGQRLGQALRGGEVIVLVGDIGAGKTTLVKGVTRGLAITDDIQSPTFTISRLYHGRDDIQLAHYDFYRLGDAGVMQLELAEAIAEPRTVTIIEWAQAVADVVPPDHLTITITAQSETVRQLDIEAGGTVSTQLLQEVSA